MAFAGVFLWCRHKVPIPFGRTSNFVGEERNVDVGFALGITSRFDEKNGRVSILSKSACNHSALVPPPTTKTALNSTQTSTCWLTYTAVTSLTNDVVILIEQRLARQTVDDLRTAKELPGSERNADDDEGREVVRHNVRTLLFSHSENETTNLFLVPSSTQTTLTETSSQLQATPLTNYIHCSMSVIREV